MYDIANKLGGNFTMAAGELKEDVLNANKLDDSSVKSNPEKNPDLGKSSSASFSTVSAEIKSEPKIAALKRKSSFTPGKPAEP